MPLARADAATYLAGQYGSGDPSLLSLAAMDDTDTTGDLKEPIDDALLLTGTAYGDLATATVADADAPTFLAALRYAAVRRILDGLNAEEVRGDIKIGTIELKSSQLIARLERSLAIDYAALKDAGLIADAASWQAPAAYSTGWIEPLPTWG